MKLHHLGIACSNIRETIDKVQNIFPVTSASEIVFDPEQNAELCMLYVKDSIPLELIAGPIVHGFVKKNIFLYHTCWEVSELEEEIKKMCDKGCHLISEPKKAVLFNYRRVAFLSSPTGILELVEAK